MNTCSAAQGFRQVAVAAWLPGCWAVAIAANISCFLVPALKKRHTCEAADQAFAGEDTADHRAAGLGNLVVHVILPRHQIAVVNLAYLQSVLDMRPQALQFPTSAPVAATI